MIAKRAAQAKKELEGVVELLEIALMVTERPSEPTVKDDFKRQFVSEVASLFNACLDKPTASPSGPFFQIISWAFEALGLPSKNPKEVIQSGLTHR